MKASDYDYSNDYFSIGIEDVNLSVRKAANALNREIAKHIRGGKRIHLIGHPELMLDKENMQYSIVQKYNTSESEE